jgi:thiol-disulfide isomerase/thioredoxin
MKRTFRPDQTSLNISSLLLLAVLAAIPQAHAQNQAPPAPAITLHRVSEDTKPVTMPTANELLRQAKVTANAEQKNILLVFTASWCGPCHLFEAFLKDPQIQPILARNFVPVRIAVGEEVKGKPYLNTPGGDFMRLPLAGVAQPGFPFLAVLTPKGDTIVTSNRPDAPSKDEANIGYPATHAEIDWFMKMLQESAPSMSPSETATIDHWLRQRGVK